MDEDVRLRCPSPGDEPGHRRGARADPRPFRRDEPATGEDGPTMTTTLIPLAAAALVVANILPTGIG